MNDSEPPLIERLEKWAEYIGRTQTTIYEDGDAEKITEDLEKAAAALAAAKELAGAVEECERMDGLFGDPTGGIAGGRKLLAALAAFRAAGG